MSYISSVVSVLIMNDLLRFHFFFFFGAVKDILLLSPVVGYLSVRKTQITNVLFFVFFPPSLLNKDNICLLSVRQLGHDGSFDTC